MKEHPNATKAESVHPMLAPLTPIRAKTGIPFHCHCSKKQRRIRHRPGGENRRAWDLECKASENSRSNGRLRGGFKA